MVRRKPRVKVALDGTHYISTLAQPIIVPHHIRLAAALQNFGLYGAQPDAVQRYVAKEQAAKLPQLFKFFGLTTGDWQGLAAKLALAHVPGFQIGSKRGAPNSKITGEKIVALLDGWRDQHPGKPLSAAIQWAIKTGALAGMKASAVRRRYDLARRKNRK